MRHNPGRTAVAIFALFTGAIVAAACGETVAPATPNVRIFIAATPPVDTATANQGARAAAHFMGGIPVEAVDSINAQLLAVALIENGDNVALASSVALTPAGAAIINLRKLPVNTVDSIEVARARLPAGSYASLRLRFKSATITFNTRVVSRGVTFEPGTYPLDMTHGITYAVEVPGPSFKTTSAGTSILLTFDVASSINGLVNSVTTNLDMNPIFRR